MKKIIIGLVGAAAMLTVMPEAMARPHHRHHDNDGLRLAAGIVNLVKTVVAPAPVVVAPAPAPVVVAPAPAPVVVAPAPAPVVVAPNPVVVPRRVVVVPPPRHRAAPPRHHRPAPPRGGHRGGHRR